MASILDRLIVPPQIEYIILNDELCIQSFSPNIGRFTDSSGDVFVGADVCLAFPELIGAEDLLRRVIQEEVNTYELREVARQGETAGQICYFNLYAHSIQEHLILLLEEVTEMMMLRQSLVQRANEAEMLLSELQHSKNYLDKVILSIGDALVVTNGLGQIKTMNRAAEEIFGYARQELLNRSLVCVIPQDVFDQELAPQAIAEYAEYTDQIKHIEVDCLHKEGQTITLEFNCSIIQTDTQQSQSFVYIGRDITARKQAELKQKQALEKERELMELKARFISIASHEFRSPIGSILMCIEMLQNPDAKLDLEETAMYLDFINQAANNLKHTMEDVLLVSRADAGKLEFNPQPIDLLGFCQRMMRHVQLSLNDYRIVFESDPFESALLLDEKLLQHILMNLLSNALKYSPAGKAVYFRVHHCPAQEQIKIEVQDQGIGIPEQDLVHIFESFHRAQNVGEIAGTGLGLAIVQRSVEIHQGKISITSQEGLGTTFTVKLPHRVWQNTATALAEC